MIFRLAPEVESEDPSPRFMADESEKIRAYYDENGYVIVKSIFTFSHQRSVIRGAKGIIAVLKNLEPRLRVDSVQMLRAIAAIAVVPLYWVGT